MLGRLKTGPLPQTTRREPMPFKGYFLSIPFVTGLAMGLALGSAALIYAA